MVTPCNGSGFTSHPQCWSPGDHRGAIPAPRSRLAEAGAGLDSNPISVEARGIEAAADWGSLQSGENYTGYERTQNFASPGGLIINQPRTYSAPVRLRLNEWALSGDWTARSDAEALNNPNGGIAYRFQARDLHLVMGPAVPGKPVRFRVLIDGRPPGEAHGLDVDENGNGTVTEQRLDNQKP